ncbi:MAG: membrane protein [Sulfurovum sp. AS07-7]|nr:MAG: membrane protein [Sulfurovum sp. AS07-7]MBD3794524.1 DUF805 domain-containing protein [Campylobacterota bacterium]
MTFMESVTTCFNKYLVFEGRATRSEFWWFVLFVVVVSIVLSAISKFLYGIFILAIFLPSLAVGARRLHDIDKSGWWQLIQIIPVIGAVILIVFFATDGDKYPNKYDRHI